MATKLSLIGAMASLLGRNKHKEYINLGVEVTVRQLFKVMGLTQSPMIYNYLNGKTLNIEPERAVAILDTFDVLIDIWDTEEELRDNADNKTKADEITKRPTKEVIEDLIIVGELPDSQLRRGLRELIAKYY